MSNKFNNFQNSSARNVRGMSSNNSPAAAAVAASSSTSPSSGGFTLAAPSNFSNDSNSSVTSNSGKAERESIHSGQFMVSTFEAEEAQDDLDDSEIKMLDPEDPSLLKVDDGANNCMEVQLYVPRKVAHQNRYGGNSESHGLITSHLEIETSLTKLFKCMNLAYSQKLTSPKWNHFKGVRLRWKDKIRLNNVIWRCWHMQFILKRKTPVCQFASPLDVDIHSNPQSVVLEGKYWKRQLAVIKAEYRKWRRNYKSKVSGCLIYDTKSEFDFLEWSPLNDRSLMLSDDWTSDTLFSAINGPFPFPDSREIARGAGIADFIQPSLGPLQPNLDDIDFTFAELLQNSRLAPVPEEGTDEMIKNVDYAFSSIMGAEQIDSSSMMDVSTSTGVPSMPNTNDDTSMLELNTPLNTLQFSDIEQQFATRSGSRQQMLPSVTRTNVPANQMQSLTSDDALMSEDENATNIILMQQVSRQQVKNFGTSLSAIVGGAGVGGDSSNIISSTGNSMGRQSNNDFPVKKGRVSKSSQRPFRREPHNYDKAQPTLHQTSIYQQMLAEQQKNQQIQHHTQHLLQPTLSGSTLQHQATVYQPTQQQQRTINNTFTQSPQQYNTNLLNNSGTYGNSTESIANIVSGQLAGQVQGQNINSNNAAGSYGLLTSSQATAQLNASNQQNNNTLQNIKIEVPSPDVLTMFNLSQGSAEGYSPYKPYNLAGNFKKSASTGTYINIRGGGNSSNNQLYMQQHDQSSSSGVGCGTIHAQSLPLTLGMHLPGLPNALQTRPPLLSPPNMQQTSQQRNIGQQLNLPSQSTQQHPTQQQQQQQQQPHQHHQSSPNQAQHLLTMLNSQQQQQQQQQPHQLQPQHQISQPTISTNNLVPKEIFRSNSLPLNVSLQKVDTRLTQHDNNFAVPTKYHVGKSSKTRSRSNSMHQHMIHSSPSSSASSSSKAMLVNSGTGAVSGGGNLNINPQLQAATSDPMLNSTLAQLLTTTKQQSVSTSSIATTANAVMSSMTGLHMQPTQLNVQNKVSTVTGPGGNMYTTTAQLQQQYHQQQQQSLSSPSSPTLINATSPTSMQQQKQFDQSQQQMQQQQKHLQTQQLHLQQQQHPHKSPKKSTSLPSPVAPSILSSPPASKMLSYPLTASSQTGCSTHLSLSPESFHDQDSPLSPTQSLKYPRDNQRRAGHIHAEQKRRYNIKNGFDQLHDLIPQLQQNNAKLSKAAMLQKGAEHIKYLRNERNVLKERMDALRMERDALNNSLTHLHSILPANGAPITRQGTEHVRQLYEQYVRCRTQDNWKFWILGLILEPLLTSYTSTVSSASLDELRRTAFLWVDQHCSLIDLRPAVSNKLKYLSMKTDILSDPPSTLQEEIAKAVNNTTGQHPNLHGT